MIFCWCENCPFNSGGCGPWDAEDKSFTNIIKIHKDHPGFQFGTPNFKKMSDVENAFSNYFNPNADEWLHTLISNLKGSSKSCLIKDRWKYVSQI